MTSPATLAAVFTFSMCGFSLALMPSQASSAFGTNHSSQASKLRRPSIRKSVTSFQIVDKPSRSGFRASQNRRAVASTAPHIDLSFLVTHSIAGAPYSAQRCSSGARIAWKPCLILIDDAAAEFRADVEQVFGEPAHRAALAGDEAADRLEGARCGGADHRLQRPRQSLLAEAPDDAPEQAVDPASDGGAEIVAYPAEETDRAGRDRFDLRDDEACAGPDPARDRVDDRIVADAVPRVPADRRGRIDGSLRFGLPSGAKCLGADVGLAFERIIGRPTRTSPSGEAWLSIGALLFACCSTWASS